MTADQVSPSRPTGAAGTAISGAVGIPLGDRPASPSICPAGDFVTIDRVHYRIINRFPVSYAAAETDAQRKARGNGPVPIVAYTSCRIERADV